VCATLASKAECGDEIMGAHEACDDGNVQENDGCSSVCSIEQGFLCDTNTPNRCQRTGDIAHNDSTTNTTTNANGTSGANTSTIVDNNTTVTTTKNDSTTNANGTSGANTSTIVDDNTTVTTTKNDSTTNANGTSGANLTHTININATVFIPSTTVLIGRGLVEQLQVSLHVEMTISMQDFGVKQAEFVLGLSELTGVLLRKIRIVGIRQVSSARRPLQGSRISVDVEIIVENRVTGNQVVSKLTPEGLNLKNTGNGLPTLQLMQVPRVLSVLIPIVTTTPLTTPAPYNVVRVFVYRMLMTLQGFDRQRNAFQRALAQAYAVLSDDVVISKVVDLSDDSHNPPSFVVAGIEIGVSISFSSFAHSEVVVGVSTINDALRQEGLPAIIERSLPDNTPAPSKDGTTGIPELYMIIFYGACAVIFVFLVVVCIRLAVGRFCCCVDANSAPSPSTRHLDTTKSQIYFSRLADSQTDYAYEHPNMYEHLNVYV